jgi:hypothetical protein
LNTSRTRCISRDSGNNVDSQGCTNGGISADGQWATFYCYGEFPLLRKIQGGAQVYLRNLLTNTTVMVGPSPTNASESITGGIQASTTRNGLSDDGRYVSFTAITSDYGTPGLAGYCDVYLWDRVLQTTTLVSNFSGRSTSWGHCESMEISANGSLVGFGCQDLINRYRYGIWDRTSGTYRFWSALFSSGLSRYPSTWSRTIVNLPHLCIF